MSQNKLFVYVLNEDVSTYINEHLNNTEDSYAKKIAFLGQTGQIMTHGELYAINNNEDIILLKNLIGNSSLLTDSSTITGAINELFNLNKLSDDYEPSDLLNASLFLAPGDSFETAFSKLEKAYIDDERTISNSLNDLHTNKADISTLSTVAFSGDFNDLLNKPAPQDLSPYATTEYVDGSINNVSNNLNDVSTRLNDTSVKLDASISELYEHIDSSLKLSVDYEPSDLLNASLFLAPGDSFETAFSKLEKSLFDNEYITANSLNDLNRNKADISTLSTVAFSGDFNDLLNKPEEPDLSPYATTEYVDGSINNVSNNLNDVSVKLDASISELYEHIDSSLKLSADYVMSSSNNENLYLLPGDSFETAFSKLEKTVDNNEYITSNSLNDLNRNKADISTLSTVAFSGDFNDLLNKPEDPDLSPYATIEYVDGSINNVSNNLNDVSSKLNNVSSNLNDVSTRLNDVSVKLDASISELYEHIDSSLKLSADYVMSSSVNDDLLLKPADTYEEAFGKLEKSIIDNEFIFTNAITELNVNKPDSSILSDVAFTGDYYNLINLPDIPDLQEITLYVDSSINNLKTYIDGSINNVSNNLNDVSIRLNDVSAYAIDISNNLNDVSNNLNDVSIRLNDVSIDVADISTRLNDISIFKLSEDYEMSDLINASLNLAPGDEYETAFSKLEKTIYDDEKTISNSLNELHANKADISTLSTVAFSGDFNDLLNKPAAQDLSDYITKTQLDSSLKLSADYVMSSSVNDDLYLLPGDSFEIAFSKLEKSLENNEYIAANSLNELHTNKADISTLSTVAFSGDFNDLLNKPAPQDLSDYITKTQLDSSLKLSADYVMSSSVNDDLLLKPTDTYEEAFGKLEKNILDNEEITAAALTDLEENKANVLELNNAIANITDISTRISNMELSDGYHTSDSSNEDLLLTIGDTYEEAFGKLEKAILDNEQITAYAISELYDNKVDVSTLSSYVTVGDLNVTINNVKNNTNSSINSIKNYVDTSINNIKQNVDTLLNKDIGKLETILVSSISGNALTLDPYKTYKIEGPVLQNIVISFDTLKEISGYSADYTLLFDASPGCNITLPSNCLYANGIRPTYVTGRTYEINITNNLVVITSFY